MAPSSKMVHYGLLVAALFKYASAECPNACSGHGDCSDYDMCNCWRNWMGNDCSERICPFSLAHVDTPLGDLNMDNTISQATWSSGWTKVDTAKYHPMYYTTGTSEKFPFTSDKRADGNVARFADTAHYYAECSNKGLCDRDSGECECFEGYEGSACQRASCPNQCSGHGTCESIRELADKDYENIYELWDRDATYGCDCDPGYYGADCSLRYCKYGVDPLYYDDEATIRTNSWSILFDSGADSTYMYGTFGVKFYDVFDEDYVTDPVVIKTLSANDNEYTGTTGQTGLKNALLGLPNTVIEDLNFNHYTDQARYVYYKITFTKNPGKARTPEVDTYLNGDFGDSSATLKSTHTTEVGTATVRTGGINGEFKDYFYSRCEGVTATVTDAGTSDFNKQGIIGYAAKLGLDTAAADGGSELDKMKKCLGDANGETSDNGEIYNWDTGASSYSYYDATGTATWTGYGVGQYPHAIKLVEVSPGDEYEGGHFYLTYEHKDINFDGTADTDTTLVLLSRLYKGDGATSGSTEFYVYTTDAVVKMVYVSYAASSYSYPSSGSSNNGFALNSEEIEAPVYGYWSRDSDTIYTSFDTSCERMNSYTDDASGTYGDSSNNQYIYPCLQKGDYIMLPDGNWGKNDDGSSAASSTWSASSNTYSDEKESNANMVSNDYVQTWSASTNIATACTNCEDHLDYSGHIFEIKKIWTAPATSTTSTREDRFRIQLDKPVPRDGTTTFAYDFAHHATDTTLKTTTKFGINPIFKFDVGTETLDGNTPTYFEYVSECSNKGICNSETGVCECFKGYTKADCGTQSAFAV